MMAIVYITTSNEKEALKIGTYIVKERLAACSNIISNMKSVYWWEGNLENDEEAILILKTVEEKVDEIIIKVKEIHSYENPCIIAIPIIKASNSYLNWLKGEIK
ncbi:MAG: divalent-cation tolerance protein CutA [Methanobrevibacter sp.]|nr:divalent-cation tolerance protein CutA [Methanobrevibacter sp.]